MNKFLSATTFTAALAAAAWSVLHFTPLAAAVTEGMPVEEQAAPVIEATPELAVPPEQEAADRSLLAEPAPVAATPAPEPKKLTTRGGGDGKEYKEFKELLDPVAEGPGTGEDGLGSSAFGSALGPVVLGPESIRDVQ